MTGHGGVEWCDVEWHAHRFAMCRAPARVQATQVPSVIVTF